MAKKLFKSRKFDSLGESKMEKVKPGDIVTWKSWLFDLESANFEEKEGLLLEILEENRLENTVLIGKIMPFGASEYEFIPLFSLKKSIKQDYL